MNYILLLLSVSLVLGKVIRVIDGDTLLVEAPWAPEPLPKEIYLRIAHIDTPELHSKCTQERALAYHARDFVTNFIAHEEPLIEYHSWDKYGGRIIGSLSVNDVDLAKSLIEASLARQYDGGKKTPWC